MRSRLIKTQWPHKIAIKSAPDLKAKKEVKKTHVMGTDTTAIKKNDERNGTKRSETNRYLALDNIIRSSVIRRNQRFDAHSIDHTLMKQLNQTKKTISPFQLQKRMDDVNYLSCGSLRNRFILRLNESRDNIERARDAFQLVSK